MREVSRQNRKEGCVREEAQQGEVGELAGRVGWHGAGLSRWKPLLSSNQSW